MSKEPAEDRSKIKVAILPNSETCREQKYQRLMQRPARDAEPFLRPLAEERRRSGSGDSRRFARRDHDKIYYSRAWRRLAGVTQVLSPDDEDATIHNRMTHSEKVALTSWSIASNLISAADRSATQSIARLGGLDAEMATTAALAHDLGHAPFGHTGEDELNDWAEEHGLSDGFEGNAQTFRIVTRVSRWDPEPAGMELRLGTLAAIAKYPWARGGEIRRLAEIKSMKDDEERGKALRAYRDGSGEQGTNVYRYWKKFGAYDDDEPVLRAARSWMPTAFSAPEGSFRCAQSLEASVMDCADDIAYAVHDFEDFSVSGLIDLDKVYRECEAWIGGNPAPGNWCERVKDGLSAADDGRFSDPSYSDAVEWLKGEISTANIRLKEEARGYLEKVEAKRTSKWVSDFVKADAFEIIDDPEADNGWKCGPVLRMKGVEWHKVAMLKALTLDFVVTSPRVAAHQRAARSTVRDLADALYEWALDKASEDYAGLPYELRAMLNDTRDAPNLSVSSPTDRVDDITIGLSEEATARCVIDYMCMLTDRNVRRLASRLNGHETAPLIPGVL